MSDNQRDFEHFWSALYGSEPASGLVELRYRIPDRVGMRQEWFSASSRQIPYVVERLKELREKTDTYLGVAPRLERSGSAQAVRHSHVLWADCDTDRAMAALKAFDPAPSLVVASGSGQHAYWPLMDPLNVRWVEQANRRVAWALGADLKATDAARILRPPGTYNHKSDPARMVRLVELRPEVYDVKRVVSHLEDPPGAIRRPARRNRIIRPHDSTDHEFLLGLEPRVYVERLTGEEVRRDGKVVCPIHADSDASMHVYGGTRGWFCFGCQRGGSVYDLAGGIWGLDTRRDFREIQKRLLEIFA